MNRLKLTTICLIGLIGLWAAALTAGTHLNGQIMGQITEAGTGQPVAGAWVAIISNNLGAETDSMGWFTIKDVPPGDYSLIVTSTKFGTVSGQADLEVTVRAGKTATLKAGMSSIKEEEKLGKSQGAIMMPGIVVDQLAVRGGRSGEVQYEAGKKDRRQKTAALDQTIRVSGDSDNLQRSQVQSQGVMVQKPGMNKPQSSPVQPNGKFRRNPAREWDAEEQSYWPSLPPFDMMFKDYGTNDFVATRRDRFSTFALDVDDASYNMARQYLMDGSLPPDEAIRIEEFINHFTYDYNPPRHDKFRIFTEITDSPFDRGTHLFKVAIKGREVDRSHRKPMNLTLVVDVSGSMGYDNRMELVKQSIRILIKQLNADDEIAIVAYDERAWTVLDPTSPKKQKRIWAAINTLRPGGSTNAEAGLRLAYRVANAQFVAGQTNSVVLFSDGVANVGRTDAGSIMSDIGRSTSRGLTLSAYGFGMGNYNDVLLEQLAKKGNGRYAYVNDLDEARRQFAGEFVGNFQWLARDVKVQVEFDQGVVESYRLLGYENREVADHQFRNNHQDGGEVGAGHEITALYEIKLTHRKRSGKAATVFVRYMETDRAKVSEVRQDVKLSEVYQPTAKVRPELRLAIVAGKFADILKRTGYASEYDYRTLMDMAKQLTKDFPGEQTRELADLIRRARDLSNLHTEYEPGGEYFGGNYRR